MSREIETHLAALVKATEKHTDAVFGDEIVNVVAVYEAILDFFDGHVEAVLTPAVNGSFRIRMERRRS